MVLFSAPVIPIYTPVSARVLVVMVISVPGPRPLFVVLSELIHFIINYLCYRNLIKDLFKSGSILLNLIIYKIFSLCTCVRIIFL